MQVDRFNIQSFLERAHGIPLNKGSVKNVLIAILDDRERHMSAWCIQKLSEKCTILHKKREMRQNAWKHESAVAGWRPESLGSRSRQQSVNRPLVALYFYGSLAYTLAIAIRGRLRCRNYAKQRCLSWVLHDLYRQPLS